MTIQSAGYVERNKILSRQFLERGRFRSPECGFNLTAPRDGALGRVGATEASWLGTNPSQLGGLAHAASQPKTEYSRWGTSRGGPTLI